MKLKKSYKIALAGSMFCVLMLTAPFLYVPYLLSSEAAGSSSLSRAFTLVYGEFIGACHTDPYNKLLRKYGAALCSAHPGRCKESPEPAYCGA